MLKEKRKKAGMTQQNLADEAKVSLRSIQEWETQGIKTASLFNAIKLSSVLKCSLDELAGLAKKEENGSE